MENRRSGPWPKIPAGSLGLFLLGLAWACEPTARPEAPEPMDPDGFVAQDSARIMADLRILAHDTMEGRRTGEPGNLKARAFIARAFQEMGLREPPGEFVQSFQFSSRRGPTQAMEGANVVGYVAGTNPELGAMVLTAHFDHVGVRNGEVFNGADDNASGVAALLAIARYAADWPLRHTVVFAALDAEESGLRGARAFIEEGWPQKTVVNVNMDMISRSDSLLFAAGTYHYPHLRSILDTISDRPPARLRFGHDEPGVEGVQDWTGSSDHWAFHSRGIPFVYFGVEDHPDSHRPTDDAEAIDPAFYLGAIRLVFASILALDQELSEAESPLHQPPPSEGG